MGVVTLTVTLKVGKVVALAATGMLRANGSGSGAAREGRDTHKPESNPTFVPFVAVARFVHGVLKRDCVTLWFFAWNWNWTTSPSAATTVGGV